MEPRRLVFLSCMFALFAALPAFADTFEVGWDRPGFDYSNFDLNNPREILCQWSCQKDKVRCRAWTFVNPGVQGPKARCWLKFAVPRPVRSRCCTSGIIN